MHVLDKIYDIACCELDELAQKGGNYDVKEIELMGELVDIVKDIEKTEMYQEPMGYSQRSYGNDYMGGRSGRMMPMYNRGRSGNSNREEMLNRLSMVADMAADEKDRKAVERLMDQMKHQDN